jgi:hypothetical protein
VAGFGALLYQTAPKLDAGLKVKNRTTPAIAYERVLAPGNLYFS